MMGPGLRQWHGTGSGSISVSRNSGNVVSFFEPTGESVARDTEGAREPAQGTALVVSAQYLLAFFFGIAIRLRVLTARPSALGAEEALFAVLRQAIASELVATAVITVEFDHL